MKKIVFTALMSALIAAPALADNTGKFYIAGGIGSTSYTNADIRINGTTNTFPNPGALGISTGYHINPNFAVELGYTSFGKSILQSTSGDVILEAKSTNLSVIGSFSVNSALDLFGKLGMANNSYKLSTTGSLIFSSGASTLTESNSSTLVGIGAQYHVNSQFSLRAQYENFGNFGSGTSPLAASAFTVGLLYDF